ncbi:MAG: glycoside hydrolase family 32 protein [Candidatus Latescibacterota bacterium]|nr:glycoside hydrolase family 32 protein [Candidatus Latescibacterota bacterium]
MPEETPNYTSKVPFYRFPDTLAEQEASLAENPLLQRMHAYRKTYLDDPHRPIYHYVNPEAMLNDPNGLCYWQDRWHLFYQAYPPEDTRQHWGHAVSDDLVHWRDLPYCIYPNPERCCYSGATLVEEDRVIAMYHGTEVGNMVAISADPLLLNWEKVANKAVVPMNKDRNFAGAIPEGQPPPRVFDPCIWKKGDAYYSITGGQLPNGPGGKLVRANFLYTSKDLEHWAYLHPFVEDDLFSMVGDDGACPYFWPVGDRHILLFFSHTSGGQYLLGDYDQDRDKFVVTNGAKFNFGPYGPAGVHAPSAAPDGEGGIIVILNMNPGKPTDRWNQIMTLPRRLTVEGDVVTMVPAGDLESLRGNHRRINRTTLPANQEITLESISGNAIEIVAEIDPRRSSSVDLNILRSPDREEFTRFTFYGDRGYRNRATGTQASTITLDSTYSSTAANVRSRAPETAHFLLAEDENLHLRVFIDRSVVEVFVNDVQCLALRVYPERSDSTGVSLHAQGQDAELISLDAWHMQNIYE